MRLLLVEDDAMLAEAIGDTLRDNGFTLDWLDRGGSVVDLLRRTHFDALILDLNLPDCDGLEVLQALRKAGISLPVLILTARDALDDRVRGLDSGADDYLSKPFATAELLARLRALLRRHAGLAEAELRYGDLRLQPERQIAYYHEQPVKLTPYEFKLLYQLLCNQGRVLTRERLQDSLYGWDEGSYGNALEVHIHHLRKKFYPELIRNIRGVGYIVPDA